MKDIRHYIDGCRERCSDLFSKLAFPLLITVFGVGLSGMIGGYVYCAVKSSHPNPPIYGDVNGDGIHDKIIQKRVFYDGILFSIPILEEETLFGVDINGKRLYFLRKQFDELK